MRSSARSGCAGRGRGWPERSRGDGDGSAGTDSGFGSGCPQDSCVLWHWVGVGPSMVPAGLKGHNCWSRQVGEGLARLAGETAERESGHGPGQGIGAGYVGRAGWNQARPGDCERGPPRGGEFIRAACCRGSGPVPTSLLAGRQQYAASAGEQEGSKRPAIQGGGGRCRANEAAGQAASGYGQLSAGFIGMQEVRGSNPRSSTPEVRAINSNSHREAAFLFHGYVRSSGAPR